MNLQCPFHRTRRCEDAKKAMFADHYSSYSMLVNPMKGVTRANYCSKYSEEVFCPYTAKYTKA